MKEHSSYFKELKTRYLSYRLGEIFLWSASAAILVIAILIFLKVNNVLIVSGGIIAFAGVFTYGFTRFRLHSLSEKRFVRYINDHHPELEQSMDLLIKDDSSLTSLQLLQKQKITEKFEKVFPTIQLPREFGRAAMLFGVSLFLSVALISFAPRERLITPPIVSGDSLAAAPKVVISVSIKDLSITITPPAYTSIKKHTVTNPQLNIPEGSSVKWTIQFSEEVQSAKIIFSGKDSVHLKKGKENFFTARTINESGFYQIYWRSKSGEVKTSDYYKIETIYDRAPNVRFDNLKQSTELTINDKLSLPIVALIADDYQVTDTYIIATVAKGSGESVKFREEKLLFTSPQKIQGKSFHASRTIDLVKLGLEPGDELYFYAEAHDNHLPIHQHSRTETYFISLQDTSRYQLSVEAGLGVDLMPEYFRSQRQIIIDTEKLLAQKKNLTKHQFNFTSNELGYDQKVLRLKYGEFLGEEFESEIAETEEPEELVPQEQTEEGEEDGDEDDMTKKFGHAHDQDNLHNLVEEKKGKDGHQHAEAEEDPEKEKDPIAAYKHSHDNVEEATFFTQSIRAKLKAALTVMWDAELHLRMYTPEKSLPYQYQALKLLKEIANDSRIYVHKTGFDPPPLKEDKRLTGDLAEIKSTQHQISRLEDKSLGTLLKCVELTDQLLHEKRAITKQEKELFRKAGRDISSLALAYPGKYLVTLSLLKNITEDEITGEELSHSLQQIRKSLWEILPDKTAVPSNQKQTHHEMDEMFIKNLEALKND